MGKSDFPQVLDVPLNGPISHLYFYFSEQYQSISVHEIPMSLVFHYVSLIDFPFIHDIMTVSLYL